MPRTRMRVQVDEFFCGMLVDHEPIRLKCQSTIGLCMEAKIPFPPLLEGRMGCFSLHASHGWLSLMYSEAGGKSSILRLHCQTGVWTEGKGNKKITGKVVEVVHLKPTNRLQAVPGCQVICSRINGSLWRLREGGRGRLCLPFSFVVCYKALSITHFDRAA